MAIDQKVVELNGNEYIIDALPATKGIVVLKQLTKLLGPSVSHLFNPVEGENSMNKAVSALMESVDSVNLESLLKDLMASVTKNNVAINFDREFRGQYDLLFMLSKEVIELNYGSLFQIAGFAE